MDKIESEVSNSDIEEDASKEDKANKSNPKSKFKHVSWYAPYVKWQAHFWHDNKIVWCGRHFSQLDAARAINRKCDSLGIKRKHPNVDDPSEEKSRKKKKKAKKSNKRMVELHKIFMTFQGHVFLSLFGFFIQYFDYQS